MYRKQVANISEKLVAQERIMHNIMRTISVLCDLADKWLQTSEDFDHAAGHPITEILSLDDALRFSSVLEHTENIERQITFQDGSSILLDNSALDTIIKNAKEKQVSLLGKKLVILIILAIQVSAIATPRKDVKSAVCMFVLDHLKEYLEAKQRYEGLLRLSVEQEALEVEETVQQAVTIQKELIAPLKPTAEPRKISPLIKILLAAGLLSAAGIAEWKLVEQATIARTLSQVTSADLSQAERTKLWTEMSSSTRLAIEAEERQNIQTLISSAATALLTKDSPTKAIPVFSAQELSTIHNYLDSALFRLSALHNELEPNETVVLDFYAQIDLVIQETLAANMVTPAAYLFTNSSVKFKYISLSEAQTFIKKYQIARKPLSIQEIAKIGLAINIYGYKTDLDPRLLLCIMWRESNFDIESPSSAGARGYMQIMPDQFRALGITNWRDVFQNIRAGTYHFYALAQSWLTGHENELLLTLAAYNTGTGNVIEFLAEPTLSVKFSAPRGLNYFIENTIYQKRKYQYRSGYLKMWGIMREAEKEAWLDFLTTEPERAAIQKLWAESQKKPYRVDFHSFNEYAPDILEKLSLYPWNK